MSTLRNLQHCVFAVLLAAGATACEREGPAERAGEEVDEAVSEAKEDAAEAKEDLKEAIDDVKGRAQDVKEDLKQ